MIKILIPTLVLICASCANSDGTSTGNPLVSIRMSSFSSMMMKPELMSVSQLKMCFKRLRFKPAIVGSEQNIDLELGEVTITSAGTFLTSAEVPAGTYSRIEFDLDSDCPSAKSLQVTNGSGSFSTDERITIRFEGLVPVFSARDLDLNIQLIIDALNTVTSHGEIKTKAESQNGSM